jgi:hypothetical protein
MSLTQTVAGVALLVGTVGCYLESEQSLRRDFETHREAFESLLRLIGEDSHLSVITPDFTRPAEDAPRSPHDAGVSNERWHQYRELLKEAGVSGGVSRWPSGEVLFVMSTRGFTIGGTTRGIAYAATLPRRLATSLNEPHKDDIVYVPLGAGWYLFDWDY